ncbi:YsnF/AvaK domain-containing protein [Pseudonocardia lacus]|uniref:YsnF/AvaK domain-containing protein n=1 Tax=Pseudonocardia lacus TaxID=2835865 RepID=UPI001BDBD829|nr:YsnF/AvaK domain-containing protein [Pseudonocardia lacus]
MSSPSADPRAWVGYAVSGAGGEPLGRVATVYTDPETGAATFAEVDVGGGASALVPLDRASADGDGIRVPHDAERVRTAPAHEPGANLSHDDVARLAEHYAQRSLVADQEPGWMVRHEERLRVLTDTVVTGRVRVRKHLVTEERTFTVEVTREEITIEHEEVPAGERAGLPAEENPAPIGEQVLELVRHEERVVVTKEVVPVERVRVIRYVVTEPEVVRGVVRREELDLQDPRS